MNPIVARALFYAHGIPMPALEHRFHATRRWRLDFAWLDQMIALEIEGGSFTRGRHTRGKGFIADIEKYNCAVSMGWKLYRCTPEQLNDGTIFETLRPVFHPKERPIE